MATIGVSYSVGGHSLFLLNIVKIMTEKLTAEILGELLGNLAIKRVKPKIHVFYVRLSKDKDIEFNELLYIIKKSYEAQGSEGTLTESGKF